MQAEIVGLCQESREAREFETRILELFARAVGFDVAFFLVKGLETSPTVCGLPQATIDRAIEGAAIYAQELMPVKRAALAKRGVAVDTEVLGALGVRRTRYHSEIARTVGGRHSLMAYVPFRGDVVGALMLGRTTQGFSSSEVTEMERMLPTLGVARATFGLPVVFEPLARARRPTFLERTGFVVERPLASRTTSQGVLEVRDRAGFREMIATSGEDELVWTRAALTDPSRSGWPYVELFHVAAALAAERRRALFIGCGGAVALRQFASAYPGIALDLVESEPAVVELAREWYALDSIPNLAVHVADGVAFIEAAAPASWDVVVVDAYDAESCSARFARRSFFASLRSSLRRGGGMAFNVIGALSSDGPLRAIVRAARAELDDVRLLPVIGADEHFAVDALRNVVVIATRPR
jgi:spermidine synthase